MSQDGKSAAEKRSEERQRMYKQVLKERENVDRKERARTAELRALRLAKEAAEKDRFLGLHGGMTAAEMEIPWIVLDLGD